MPAEQSSTGKANVWPGSADNRSRFFRVNDRIEVPQPFKMKDFLEQEENEKVWTGENSGEGEGAGVVPLFGADHPDKEFKVNLCGPTASSGRTPP